MRARPLARLEGVTFEDHPLRSDDGLELGLTRVFRDGRAKAAVLLTHGQTASTDMFVLPETRNLVAVLLDAGYEPWLLDWRGSCRLPYNETGPAYSYDDVALYDIPGAVSAVRERIGAQKLFVVAHCIGALSLALSMTAGLVPGLAGVVAQGVFLTPKMKMGLRLRMGFLGEVLQPLVGHIPVDFRKVGLWSRYTPLFALAGLGAECADPTCQLLNSAWGTGASLFVHGNLHPRTHDRLAELLGPAPTWTLPHLRKVELARAVVPWHEADPRYRSLPPNALDCAHRIDCPVLLLSGRKNAFWGDSNKLCMNVLTKRQPQLDLEYVEVPSYGHLDTIIGRSAAIDVFPHVVRWLDQRTLPTVMRPRAESPSSPAGEAASASPRP
jgi:pimeloyl-ACP methyl ester carboxylesterase